jgi:hypothetical protein
VQVAVNVVALTVTDGQSAIAFPLIEKLIVPVGAIGVNVAPPRVAVKVSGVSTVTELAGCVVKASVGVSGVTVCVIAAGLAVLKLASPEYEAAIVSVGATSVEVVQVALNVVALTVTDGQSAIAFPLIEKLIVPLGAVGANVAPPRVAVKVAAVLRFTGPEG